MVSESAVLPDVDSQPRTSTNGQHQAPQAAATANAQLNDATTDVDWTTRTAEEIEAAIRLALAEARHLTARELSQIAARLHPEHETLQKIARILAPPTVTKTGRRTDPREGLNTEWMRDNWRQHRERWVAVRHGQLVETAPSLQELKQKVGDLKGLFVTYIS